MQKRKKNRENNRDNKIENVQSKHKNINNCTK